MNSWSNASNLAYHLDLSKVPSCRFEMGPIRPPSEGQDRSLLIRVNRNCPWNRCQFCGTYKGQKFSYRSAEEVKQDIDVAKAIADGLKAASWTLGYGGVIRQEVLSAVIRGTPEVYGRHLADTQELTARLNSLVSVANWLSAGARTVFLQDGNSVIMRQKELVDVLQHLNETFPTIERITSYARAKTMAQRSVEELQALRLLGLKRLHLGLESGCAKVLTFMDKGVTPEEQIRAGQQVKAAGMELSEYMMPGLGGRRWSTTHAIESADVLNQVNADFIRLRSLIVRRGLPLYDKMQSGDFVPLSEDEVVDEIGLFVENLNCHSYLVSDQMSNLLWEVEGQLPGEKPAILHTIRQYKAMDRFERLAFRLQRRAQSFMSVYGGVTPDVAEAVETAFAAIRQEDPEAEAKVDRAIEALKQGFI